MLATQNLLKPSSGEPIVGPSKDMVMGVYYLTVMDERLRRERSLNGNGGGPAGEWQPRSSVAGVCHHGRGRVRPRHGRHQAARADPDLVHEQV